MCKHSSSPTDIPFEDYLSALSLWRSTHGRMPSCRSRDPEERMLAIFVNENKEHPKVKGIRGK